MTWQKVDVRENDDPVHMLYHKVCYIVTLKGSKCILSVIKYCLSSHY